MGGIVARGERPREWRICPLSIGCCQWAISASCGRTMSGPLRPDTERTRPVTGEPTHRVAILALDAVVPIGLAIPAQVFDGRDGSPYSATLCATDPGPVRTTTGF